VKISIESPAGVENRELAGDELVIGRAEECGLALADRAVSRRHARLVREGERWYVEDLGSRAGTLLNGRTLVGRAPLAPGDRLALGSSRIQFSPAAPAASAPSTAVPGTSIFLKAEDLLAGARAAAAGDDPTAALRRRAERLELLNQVHHALGRSLALDELLELILDRAFQALEPEEGVIVLRDAAGSYRRAAARRPPGSVGDALLSKTLLEEVVEKRQAALVCDVASDDRFGQAQSLRLSGVRSLIAAPLYDEAGPLGMVALDSRAFVRPFAEDDLELLTSLASVASLRIRNVALAEEAAERRRLEEELALARSIQVGLLPRALPAPAGWSVFGASVPSRWVSGDYYLLEEHGGALTAMLADVSGKGIGAALLTASLEALCAGPLESELPPGDVFTRVSRRLYRRTPPAKYATAVLARVELASGRVTLANAGHNPTLVVRAGGDVEQLGATGVPLGLLPESAYREQTLELAPGDLLVLYSDGFVEPSDAGEQEFGLTRFAAALAAGRSRPLAELARAVESAVREFVGGEPDADDRTLVLMRREPL